MKKMIYILLFVSLFTNNIFAQNEIQAEIGYFYPLKNMSSIYSPTYSYGINYRSIEMDGNTGFSLGVGLAYSVFNPKTEVFYYLVGPSEYGTLKYTDYKMFQLVGFFEYHFTIFKVIEPSLGLHLGFYYYGYSYELKDKFRSISGKEFSADFGFSPKAMIQINLSENFGISISAINHFLIQISNQSTDHSMNYLTGIYFRFN